MKSMSKTRARLLSSTVLPLAVAVALGAAGPAVADGARRLQPVRGRVLQPVQPLRPVQGLQPVQSLRGLLQPLQSVQPL